jgi:hypothetical protein
MPDPILALTLHRPWSWAVSHGPKRIENRSWRPPARTASTFLAIHAGKRYDDDARLRIAKLTGLLVPSPAECPEGIVAVCRVAGVASSKSEVSRVAGAEQRPWFFGPYGWLLFDVTPIEPVPCRGAQGLWTPPPDVVEEVMRRLAAARVKESAR